MLQARNGQKGRVRLGLDSVIRVIVSDDGLKLFSGHSTGCKSRTSSLTSLRISVHSLVRIPCL
jgi:hypothetical protein